MDNQFIVYCQALISQQQKEIKHKDRQLKELQLGLLERIFRRFFRDRYHHRRRNKLIEEALKEYGGADLAHTHPIFHRAMFRGDYKGNAKEINLSFRKFPQFPIKIRTTNTDPDPFRQVFLEKQYKPVLEMVNDCHAILDLGANVGYSVLWFAMQYPAAHIVAVEPLLENFEFLKKQVQGCKLKDRVTLIHGAISTRNEHKDIYIEENEYYHTGASLIKEKVGKIPPVKKHSVNCYDLKTLYETSNIDRFDIVKIDIQGMERYLFSEYTGDFSHQISLSKVVMVENHELYDHYIVDSFFEKLRWEKEHFHENTFYINPSPASHNDNQH